MTLRSKLTVLFFAALQVTFLTAVGTFWAVQSWQLLTDDLTLIHDQNLRLERAVDGGRPAALRALRHHAQSLEEVELVDALAKNPAEGAQRLKKFYHAEVNRLRERARFVTRLSTGLFLAIVTLVLAGMMAYFTAIRVWLVRPLQALGRATGVISTGDLAHRIPVSGRDEFGTLAESINAMAASLVERCAALARAQLAGKGLRLELALEPALASVPLDRNKMEQVFSAVLANAMDASPAGATIRVSSALRQPNHVQFACIRVEDAGPGIPADRVGKLFTLFSTTKKSGTGLGLALAQKIVTAHDGTISVTSRAGEGTVVEISLPATERSAPRGDDPHR